MKIQIQVSYTRNELLCLTHLQHTVQHVHFSGLMPRLRQSKALWGSDPGDPLDHSLHPGKLHQHILVLWTQTSHKNSVVKGLTQNLMESRQEAFRGTEKQDNFKLVKFQKSEEVLLVGFSKTYLGGRNWTTGGLIWCTGFYFEGAPCVCCWVLLTWYM